MINGSAINGTPINGPGTIAETLKDVIKASSDIPISARKEIDEVIDDLEDHALESIQSALDWFQNATQSDLPNHVYHHLDQIIQAIQTLFP